MTDSFSRLSLVVLVESLIRIRTLFWTALRPTDRARTWGAAAAAGSATAGG